jgi:hypothetical protein
MSNDETAIRQLNSLRASQGGSDDQLDQEQQNAYNLDRNMTTTVRINPWLADDPEALMLIAETGQIGGSFVDQSAQLFGMQSADQLLNTMNKISPGAQRGAWGQLTQLQQGSLISMGYDASSSTPDQPFRGRSVVGKIGAVAGAPFKAFGSLVGPPIGATLNAIDWMEKRGTNFYRAIRTQDSDVQWMALAGAIGAGAAAVVAAPATGGVSLGTLGVIGAAGAGAIAGGTAATMVATSPQQWWEAYNDTYDGEKVFRRSAQSDARAILAGDEQLTSLAREIAWNSDVEDLYDMAEEVAGVRDSGNQSVRLASLERVASTMAEPGTPEYDRAYELLYELMEIEEFSDAVQTLESGKMSFGRDFAQVLSLDPGDTGYGTVSGGLDALWLVAVDPTLALGKANKLYRSYRLGISMEGASMGIRHAITHNRSVERAFETVATAVRNDDLEYVASRLPEAVGLLMPLGAYKRAKGIKDFQVDDMLDFFETQNDYASIMAGQFTKRGEESLMLASLPAQRVAFNKIKWEVRQAIDVLDDDHMMSVIRKAAKKNGDEATIFQNLPTSLFSREDVKFNEVRQAVSGVDDSFRVGNKIGQALDRIPGTQKIGAVLGSLASKLPPGTAVDIAGDTPEAAAEIRQMVEMGRMFGVSAETRRWWTDAILAQDNKTLRIHAASAYVDTMLHAGGLYTTKQGDALANQFITKWRQTYGFVDDVTINGRPRRVGELPMKHDADVIVIPDFKEMRKAVRRGIVLRGVLGVTDSELVEQKFMKFWKPAVLLRIGFIPRAAGEELVALLARTDIRDFSQTRRGKWHIDRDIAKAVDKMEAKHRPQYLLDGTPVPAMKRVMRTDAEQEAINQRWAPGTRWAGNMMANSNRGNPLLNVLEGYASFLDTITRDGALQMKWFAQTKIGGFQFANKIEDASNRYQAGAWSMAEGLVLGKKRSQRNMWMNGVDPTITTALRDGWFTGHIADDVMRELSAGIASVIAAESPKNNVVRAITETRRGVEKEVDMVVYKGAVQLVQRGDTHFAGGVHQFQREPFDDIVVAPAIVQTLSGYVDPTIGLAAETPAKIGDLVDRMDELVNIGLVPPSVQGVISQLIGTSNESTWLGLAEKLQESDPRMAIVIREALHNDVTMLGPNSLRQIMDDYDALVPQFGVNPKLTVPMRDTAYVKGQMPRKAVDELESMMNEYSSLISNSDMAQTRWIEQFTSARRKNPGMKITTTYEEMVTDLTESVRLQLLAPENQKWVQGSIKAHTVNGRMMNTPAADGTVRMFAPSVSVKTLERVRREQRYFGSTDEAINRLIDMFNKDKHRFIGNSEGFIDVDDEVLRNMFRRYMELPNDEFGKIVRMSSETGSLIPAAVVATTDPRVARSVGMFFEHMTGKLTLKGPITQFDVAGDAAHLRAGVGLDGATPISFDGVKGQEVFSLDVKMLGDRGVRVQRGTPMHDKSVGYTYEQSIDEMARSITEDTVLARFRDMSGTKAVRRDDNVDVFTRDGAGNRTAVETGTKITSREEYTLEDGSDVKWGAPEYFDMENALQTQRITWETISPLIQDHLDLVRNEHLTTVKRKIQQIDPAADPIMDPSLLVNVGSELPALRAHPSQVFDIPGSLQPDIIATEIYHLKKEETWDHFVTKGFGAISRSIDAIVRRPMALHMYVNAYSENAKRLRWLYDPETMKYADEQLAPLIESLSKKADDGPAQELAGLLARARNDRAPASPFEARMYLATSYDFSDKDELKNVVKVLENQMRKEGNVMTPWKSLEQDFEQAAKWGVLKDDPTAEALINRVAALQPPHQFGAKRVNPFKDLNKKQISAFTALQNNMDHANKTIASLSKQRAIENTVPFLDSHEFKSQFADWGRGIMPFWYAEENFLKRVARTALISPEAIRKLQITYMGIQEVGLIRTDQNGKDWFVYPGSQALGDALAPLMGINGEVGMEGGLSSMGLFFEASTDQLLPGYSGEPGKPSFAPMITVAMDTITDLFPELEPIQRSIVGDLSTDRGKLEQLVPTTITRAFAAVGVGGADSYASATMAAFAMMAANGQIPENPTALEFETVLKRARNHARMTSWVKTLIGFVSPGSPRASMTGGGEGLDIFAQLGFNNVNTADIFNTEFRELTAQMGIDEGTQAYLNRNPDHDMFDFVNPIAFTMSRTESDSGAPMPTSVTIMNHYDENEGWYKEFDQGGPWLFPQDDDPFNSQAYNEQVSNGLRKRKTSEEFIKNFYEKDASIEYYKIKDEHEQLLLVASESDSKVMKEKFKEWSTRFMILHPIFEASHLSTDKRTRRSQVLRQVIVAGADPARPRNKYSDSIVAFTEAFQRYDTHRRLLGRDQTGDGRDKLNAHKAGWLRWSEQYVMWNPNTEAFWMSIIEPQSELN